MKKYLLQMIILSFAAGAFASGNNAPPPPPVSYADNICTVKMPNVTFTVNTINGKAPASLSDCQRLMPPPPGGQGLPPQNNQGQNSGAANMGVNRPAY